MLVCSTMYIFCLEQVNLWGRRSLAEAWHGGLTKVSNHSQKLVLNYEKEFMGGMKSLSGLKPFLMYVYLGERRS